MENKNQYKNQLKKLYAWMSSIDKAYTTELSLKDRVQDVWGVSKAWWVERKKLIKSWMIVNNIISQLDWDFNIVKRWDSAKKASKSINVKAWKIITACRTWGICKW